MVQRFDIVMVTDTRLPGGTSASVAEEVTAQARAGYRTAILQVDSPLVRASQAPMSTRLRACLERGDAQLLLGDDPVETDLVVIRHPTVAASIDPARVPRITATNRVLVANQAPGVPARSADGGDQGPTELRFRPEEVDAHVSTWLGGDLRWVPIGPLVRDDLLAVAPQLELPKDDWVNIIDVDAWRRPRPGALHRVPVIGRHSRNDPMKWPSTAAELLQIYPARDDVEVHVLGGEPQARRLLERRIPDNWVIHPFGSITPERFLAGVDVYAYYHHHQWIEAFGRSILEAMASGAPTILPPHFRALFADAATYAEPAEVLGRVYELHGDDRVYREAADRGTTFVEERFGHGVHVERIAELASPTGTARPVPGHRAAGHDVGVEVEEADRQGAADEAMAATSVSDPPRRRVLLVTTNGSGVGHLMRLLSLARRAPAHIDPVFLTFSQGGKVVDDAGYLVEYLASRPISGARSVVWHPMLRERVNELIERYDARAVVFDGTWPYQGLLDAAADQPQTRLVWSRRAMWKPAVTNDVLDLETDRFDLIIEPGEFAAEEDRGATVARRDEAVRVGPITYLGLEELYSREQARAELGLDPDRPAALVNLGAGNINDLSSLLGRVVNRLAAEPDLQVCVTRSIIADRDQSLPANVRTISVYPLARYLHAFDLAVAASGYNSYHELLLAAVPTAFIPNLDTSSDDQAARSRFADRVGVGVDVPEPTDAAIDRAARILLDPERRRRMHERAVARRLDNGAQAAMQALTEVMERPRTDARSAASLNAMFAARKQQRQPAPATGAPEQLAPAPDPTAAAEVTQAPGASVSPAPDPGVPAAVGANRDGGLRRLPARVLGRLRSVARGVTRRIAGLSRREQLRAAASRPYRLLPPTVRRLIKRRLQGWETPQLLAQVRDHDPRLPVPPGTVLGEDPPEDLTALAIVLPHQADGEVVGAIVDHVAQLQAALRSFRPLFITYQTDLRAFRRYGYLVEHFPGRDRWERVPVPEPWHRARAERLRTVLRRFAIDDVLVLPAPDEDDLEGLQALVGAALEGALRPD